MARKRTKLSFKKILGFGILVLSSLVFSYLLLNVKKPTAPTTSNASAATQLSFSPSTVQKNINDTFTVDILMNPGTNLVSLATLDVQYDTTKITLIDNGFTANTQVFPTILEGPIYNSGRMLVKLSIGSDPTKAVNTPGTKVGTLSFKVGNTNNTTTAITFGDLTYVLSIGPNDSATDNVLSGSTPAQIAIGNAQLPSPTNPQDSSPTPLISPTEIPSPTNIGGPSEIPTLPISPTNTIIPTPIDGTPVVVPPTTIFCPAGMEQVTEFRGDALNNNPGTDVTVSFTVASGFQLSNASLLAWKDEGHPEKGCQIGPNNDNGKSGCDQYQQNEGLKFYLNNAMILHVPDRGQGFDDAWFPFSKSGIALREGANTLKITHENTGSGAGSTKYKGVLCAVPDGTTPGITQGESPSPTQMQQPSTAISPTISSGPTTVPTNVLRLLAFVIIVLLLFFFAHKFIM